jgi:hypothetical protein
MRHRVSALIKFPAVLNLSLFLRALAFFVGKNTN